MNWKYRTGGSWGTGVPKVRRNGEWRPVGQPDSGTGGGGESGGASEINVGNPGEVIFQSPMDSWDELDRFHSRSYTSNISIQSDPSGQHGDVTAMYADEGDVRGADVAWAPNEGPRDGSRSGENDPKSLYAQQWIYYPEDAEMYIPGNSTHGHKAGGISGLYTDAAGGGTDADGHSFSARIQTDVETDSTSNSGFTMHYMPYHLDNPQTYGDRESWDGSWSFGEWHKITLYCQMNTPGQNDGILRGWMNDELCYERENYRFRDEDHPEAGITRAYGGYVYWGGSWGSPKDQNVYFRDFTVAHGD